jgi:nitrite reductase/ring-hydroxylating ferredoxin subunit
VSPDVLQAVDEAIATLQSHPDRIVRDAAQALLEGIDAVHRLGLTHLVQAIHGMAGEGFLNRLTADPAIRLLLMSYNLIAVDRRLQAEEALDTVRGHLHDHGVDVEILGVVGGVVTVRLHWRARSGGAIETPVDAVSRDLEAALLEHFVGFQEVVVKGRSEPPAAIHHVPLDALRPANRPIYSDALGLQDLREGSTRAVDVNGVPVLLARVDGDVYAVRNRCGESPLPLEFGSLIGSELHCSWHGCRYDVRSGRRVDGEAGSIQVFPVSIDEERIRIALDVTRDGGEA